MASKSSNPTSFSSFLYNQNITRSNPGRCELLLNDKILPYLELATPKGQARLWSLLQRLSDTRNTSAITKLKIVMLLHNIVIMKQDFCAWLLEHPVEVTPTANIETEGKKTDTNSIVFKAAKVYYSYVIRICAHDQLYDESRSKKTCQENDKTVVDPELAAQKIYMLINLIRSLCPMKNFITYCARYQHQDFKLAVDVNRSVAYDLARLYNHLSYYACLIRNQLELLTPSQLGEFQTIVDEIYMIHDNMHGIFFNRYYCMNLYPVTIYWFKLNFPIHSLVKGSRQNSKHSSVKLSQIQKDGSSKPQSHKRQPSPTSISNRQRANSINDLNKIGDGFKRDTQLDEERKPVSVMELEDAQDHRKSSDDFKFTEDTENDKQKLQEMGMYVTMNNFKTTMELP